MHWQQAGSPEEKLKGSAEDCEACKPRVWARLGRRTTGASRLSHPSGRGRWLDEGVDVRWGYSASGAACSRNKKSNDSGDKESNSGRT